jgi:glucose-1-phosphate thymidylyltransferase
MKAVVPAAGEGTRMRPLTADRPKGLVEVGGRPLLAHVFEALGQLNPDELVVVVGYRGDAIRDHFGAQFDGIPLRYVTQPERNGLADALLQAAPHVGDEFVVLNGDNVARANLGDVVERHRRTDADVTALVEQVSCERAREGAVFERDDDRITGIVEKPADPPSRLVPRSFYAFSPVIFHACRLVTPGRTGERELTDAIDLLLAAGRRLETVSLDGWCVNVNTPADCERVARKLTADSEL